MPSAPEQMTDQTQTIAPSPQEHAVIRELREENASIKQENIALRQDNISMREQMTALRQHNISIMEENTAMRKERTAKISDPRGVVDDARSTSRQQSADFRIVAANNRGQQMDGLQVDGDIDGDDEEDDNDDVIILYSTGAPASTSQRVREPHRAAGPPQKRKGVMEGDASHNMPNGSGRGRKKVERTPLLPGWEEVDIDYGIDEKKRGKMTKPKLRAAGFPSTIHRAIVESDLNGTAHRAENTADNMDGPTICWTTMFYESKTWGGLGQDDREMKKQEIKQWSKDTWKDTQKPCLKCQVRAEEGAETSCFYFVNKCTIRRIR